MKLNVKHIALGRLGVGDGGGIREKVKSACLVNNRNCTCN